jgi:hypothetical protein
MKERVTTEDPGGDTPARETAEIELFHLRTPTNSCVASFLRRHSGLWAGR